jgi:hypothetical protein
MVRRHVKYLRKIQLIIHRRRRCGFHFEIALIFVCVLLFAGGLIVVLYSAFVFGEANLQSAPASTIQLTGNNLDPIGNNNWSVHDYSEFAHNPQFSNVHLDYGVTGPSGGPSIRIDPIGSSANSYRECNGLGLPVEPGQQIIFSVWIKTTASSLNDDAIQSGGRIGIDMYDGNWNGICPTFAPSGEDGSNLNAFVSSVHWGTSSWTKLTETFKVAPQYTYMYRSTGGSGAYNNGDLVTPAYIVPWMQVWSAQYGGTDQGTAWFADPELYIFS